MHWFLFQRKRVVRGEDIKVKRPEQFVMEYKTVREVVVDLELLNYFCIQREGSLNKKLRKERQEARRSQKKSQSQVKTQNTVGFVVRIHEGRHSNNEIKKDLAQLGLRKKYDGVFFNLDSDGIGKH